MKQHLAKIALVVKDYDEAIAFYTQKLNFELKEDTKLSDLVKYTPIEQIVTETDAPFLTKIVVSISLAM